MTDGGAGSFGGAPAERSSRSLPAVPAAAGVVLGGALFAMAWWPAGSATPLPLLALWAVAFGAYCVAAARAGAIPSRTIWAGGLVLRAGLLPAAPTLSEDIYRYVWDGWVQANGVNPFAHAPSAPELAPLRLEWWPLINHADVPTIYPPGAQILFLLLALVGPAWLVFKLAWVAADLLAARLVARLAGSGADGRRVLILYLWSPLLLVEVAWSGHLESLGVAAMLGAAALTRAGTGGSWRSRLGSGALIGLGASIKLAPLAVVPALWRRYGAAAAAVAVLVPVALYVPYAGAGAGLFEGLRTYADVWAFNAGAFRALEALPGEVPRALAALGVVAVAAWAAVRRFGLERALYWTIGAALLLSPTIHPWYLLWILPFACLRRGRGWILYTGTVFLAYAGRDAYVATGTWPEPVWLTALIHVPPLALLAWDAARGGGDPGAPRDGVPERPGSRDPLPRGP